MWKALLALIVKDEITIAESKFLAIRNVIEEQKSIRNLKLVTQTERIPASAAARQATGTTSETCFRLRSDNHNLDQKMTKNPSK